MSMSKPLHKVWLSCFSVSCLSSRALPSRTHAHTFSDVILFFLFLLPLSLCATQYTISLSLSVVTNKQKQTTQRRGLFLFSFFLFLSLSLSRALSLSLSQTLPLSPSSSSDIFRLFFPRRCPRKTPRVSLCDRPSRVARSPRLLSRFARPMLLVKECLSRLGSSRRTTTGSTVPVDHASRTILNLAPWSLFSRPATGYSSSPFLMTLRASSTTPVPIQTARACSCTMPSRTRQKS
jgi:hypothetical protein